MHLSHGDRKSKLVTSGPVGTRTAPENRARSAWLGVNR
jgi:hypothetical protein